MYKPCIKHTTPLFYSYHTSIQNICQNHSLILHFTNTPKKNGKFSPQFCDLKQGTALSSLNSDQSDNPHHCCASIHSFSKWCERSKSRGRCIQPILFLSENTRGKRANEDCRDWGGDEEEWETRRVITTADMKTGCQIPIPCRNGCFTQLWTQSHDFFLFNHIYMYEWW